MQPTFCNGVIYCTDNSFRSDIWVKGSEDTFVAARVVDILRLRWTREVGWTRFNLVLIWGASLVLFILEARKEFSMILMDHKTQVWQFSSQYSKNTSGNEYTTLSFCFQLQYMYKQLTLQLHLQRASGVASVSYRLRVHFSLLSRVKIKFLWRHFNLTLQNSEATDKGSKWRDVSSRWAISRT